MNHLFFGNTFPFLLWLCGPCGSSNQYMLWPCQVFYFAATSVQLPYVLSRFNYWAVPRWITSYYNLFFLWGPLMVGSSLWWCQQGFLSDAYRSSCCPHCPPVHSQLKARLIGSMWVIFGHSTIVKNGQLPAGTTWNHKLTSSKCQPLSHLFNVTCQLCILYSPCISWS